MRPPAPDGPERGSVLLLVPVGVFAVLVLAAISVDSAHLHLAHHQLELAAAAAANDAASAALDEGALRAGQGLVVDPARARQVVAASLRAGGVEDRLATSPQVAVGPEGEVTVELAAEVPPVFGAALPGRGPALVRAAATATSERR